MLIVAFRKFENVLKKSRTSLPSAEFEPAFQEIKGLQTYALDGTAIVIDQNFKYCTIFRRCKEVRWIMLVQRNAFVGDSDEI
jgi:hypothetical protein